MNSRKNILQRLKNKTSNPKLGYPSLSERKGIFASKDATNLVQFSERFVALGGTIVCCANEAELLERLLDLLHAKEWQNKTHCYIPSLEKKMRRKGFQNSRIPLLQQEVGITSCKALIARTGSILVDAAAVAGRKGGIVPPIHIIVAKESQVVADIADVLATIEASMSCIVSGNSRTADIEKTLVNGAHGPKQLYLFLVVF